jgi:hypothetical protein
VVRFPTFEHDSTRRQRFADIKAVRHKTQNSHLMAFGYPFFGKVGMEDFEAEPESALAYFGTVELSGASHGFKNGW